MTCLELASRAQVPPVLPATQGLHAVHGAVYCGKSAWSSWASSPFSPGHLTLPQAAGWEQELP